VFSWCDFRYLRCLASKGIVPLASCCVCVCVSAKPLAYITLVSAVKVMCRIQCSQVFSVILFVCDYALSRHMVIHSVEQLQEPAWCWMSVNLYSIQHAFSIIRYPAALATLADLEEVSPTESRPPALDIYTQSVNSSRLHYDDTHIYPYTFLGNYYYRRANYKEALRNWAEAARVISRYVFYTHKGYW